MVKPIPLLFLVNTTATWLECVKHQGRHFTEGAVGVNGLWIIGGKRLITSYTYKCVTCRKLRGQMEQQQMMERLRVEPPFSCVGLDVFGPWGITARRTRGGQAKEKRWAVHMHVHTGHSHTEVVENMTSSCFIHALRRFFAIRGCVKQSRCDCGSNFVGACKELNMDSMSPTDSSIGN